MGKKQGGVERPIALSNLPHMAQFSMTGAYVVRVRHRAEVKLEGDRPAHKGIYLDTLLTRL